MRYSLSFDLEYMTYPAFYFRFHKKIQFGRRTTLRFWRFAVVIKWEVR